MTTSKTLLKIAPYAVWVFFAFFSLRYAIEIFNGGNGWKTGDWLINYSAGPIRRGFTGSLLILISNLGLPLLWLTYIFQVIFYALIYSNVIKIYTNKRRGVFWLLIIFSPTFLLFPFYDLQGGFRKEIIVFSIFSYFCLIYSKKIITNYKINIILITYVIASLSHELTIFTLPFFLYVLYIGAIEGQIATQRAIVYGIALVFSSIIILLLASIYKGNEAQAALICESLINRKLDPKVCEGAISWLREDSGTSVSKVTNELNYKSFFAPILFAASMLPLFFTTWWQKKTFILLISSILAISPLFFVAIDWGRWIHILIFMFYCLVISVEVYVKYEFKIIFLIAGIFYLTTWSIPHCCVGGIGNGLIKFF